MDEATWRTWQTLHTRAARGETLTPEEQAFYEQMESHLDDLEVINGGYDAQIVEFLKKIAESERENARLREQRRELEARVAALEATLTPKKTAISGASES